MSRMALLMCLVGLMVLPLAHVTLQAQTAQQGVQGNQEHTPYYDPRYIRENSDEKNTPGQAIQNQDRELPRTTGQQYLLAAIGVLSIAGGLGLRLAIYSSRG